MKLVCDSCGTKYSIGDDKVAGKVFKIRCKKCSNVIVVRGVTPAPDEEWHAVLDGEQRGPLTRDQLAALAPDTLVWRDGMADWVELASLDGAPASSRAEPSQEVSDERVGPKLVAERNESSQLFTLGNLAKLAGPTASTAKLAPNEGSGLLDIRSLASTLAARPSPAVSDEFPVTAPSGFGEPIVIMPAVRRGPDSRLVAALVATLALLATLAIVLVVVVTREPEVQAAIEAPARVATLGPTGGSTSSTASANTATTDAPNTTDASNRTSTTSTTNAPTSTTDAPTTRTRTNTTRANTTRANTTRTNTTVTTNECSEVSCVVNNYADACCAIYKPGGMPEKLDKSMIAKGLGTIAAKACKGSGEVSLLVTVSPAGTVASVAHRGPGDTPLAQCVAATARRGTFQKTQRGGSFGYIWRF